MGMKTKMWRAKLAKAERVKDANAFFEALALGPAELEELDAFMSDLREEGYSVRCVMLDSYRVMRYRVFLPRGSRMEDAGVNKPASVPYEDPAHGSFMDLRKMMIADLAAERRRNQKEEKS